MERDRETLAYVAIGSNLGDRRALVEGAIERIDAIDGVRVMARSSVIETEPVGPVQQGRYLNGVVGVETRLGAMALLEALLSIERSMGRERDEGVRWGPRTIDLDLLLYGEEVFEREGVVVPHPRMHERLFVLRPLAEIAPGAIHPGLGRTVAALLAEVEANA